MPAGGQYSSSGNYQAKELTGTQITALLDLFTNVLKGVVPPSGGGITNFLRADGAWAAPAGGASVLTRITGASGAGGSDLTWQTLLADSAAITSTTPTVVMSTTGLSSGTYRFKYFVCYRSAATGTGIAFAVNPTAGVVTVFVSRWTFVTTGGAAANGVGDQVTSVTAGQLVEGKAERVKNTATSPSAGVDTANADMLAVVEGLYVVPAPSAPHTLELKAATEVAGSAITVRLGSNLTLERVAT